MRPLKHLRVEKTVVLFDPYFKSMSGHHARYARVLGQQAKRRGLKLIIAANAALPVSVVESLKAEGAFVLPTFQTGNYFLYRQVEHQRGHAVSLANQALAVLGEIPTRRTAWLSGIPSFVEAAVLCASRHRTPAAFQLIDFGRDWPAAPLAAPERVRQALQAGESLGMTFFAQGQFICGQLASETGTTFRPLRPILDYKPMGKRLPGQKPTVGALNLGYTFKNLAALLPLVAATRESVHWIFHFGEFIEPALKPLVTEVTAMGVEVHRGSLGVQAYNALWSRLDVTVLPYDVTQYSRQGSGMVFEAISDGIVPIVPDGTSMADLLRRCGVGKVYDSTTADGLQSAFHDVVASLETMRPTAQSYAMQWRQDNTPSNVFDDLEAAWSRKPLTPMNAPQT